MPPPVAKLCPPQPKTQSEMEMDYLKKLVLTTFGLLCMMKGRPMGLARGDRALLEEEETALWGDT